MNCGKPEQKLVSTNIDILNFKKICLADMEFPIYDERVQLIVITIASDTVFQITANFHEYKIKKKKQNNLDNLALW